MKHAVAFILILSLLLSFPVTASAEEHHTTVTANVSELYDFSVIPTENGHVFHEGKRIDGGTIQLHYRTQPKITIIPNSGYAIDKVLLDGVDVTDQLVGGVLTLPEILQAQTLTVTFQKAAQNLNRRHRVDIEGTVTLNGVPLRGAIVELRPQGETSWTDRSGGYYLDGAALGSHDLLIWKDGVLVGYTQLEIQLTDRRETLQAVSGGYRATVKESTESIRLDLALTDDGTVGMGHFKTYEFWETATSNPKTGDLIMVSVTVMTLSGAGLAYLLLRWKKRKNQEI